MIEVKDVAAAIGRVYDPELGIDVISLGLIYGIEVEPARVSVTMTTTTESCPMSEVLFQGVGMAVNALASGASVEIWPVADPPWNVEMMTDAARRQLGLPPAGSHERL